MVRRKRDSNPRFRGYRTTVFKTAAFDRSAISPFLRRKDNIFLIFRFSNKIIQYVSDIQ